MSTEPNRRRWLLTLETGRDASCSQLRTTHTCADSFAGFTLHVSAELSSREGKRGCFGKAKGCCYHGNSTGACNPGVHFAISAARSGLHVAARGRTATVSQSGNAAAVMREG